MRFDANTNRFRTFELFDSIVCDPPYGKLIQL